MKSIARNLIPPVAWNAASRVKNRFRARRFQTDEQAGTTLFDGDESLFKTYAPRARLYGEYGLGASTLWVAAHTKARIRSVDTSKEWVNRIAAQIPPDRATFIWVDVGPLRNWGRPLGYSKRAGFRTYAQALWNGPDKPDLVLIDGRFRVACFLTSLAEADPGTHILFDDYIDRPQYHLVEEFLRPSKRTERQALFVVPEAVDQPTLREEAGRFAMVVE